MIRKTGRVLDARFLPGLWLALLLGVLALATPVHAAALPSGFSETIIASGLGKVTSFAIAPDGRIFVTEQDGSLRVIKNGTLLATPFVTLPVDNQGERGLLGVTLHPDLATDPESAYVYVYYTVPGTPSHNRLSRFLADGDVATGDEEILVDLENLSDKLTHNGGALHFGADDLLYVAVGDNANATNAETLDSRFGKILRYTAEGEIPESNPFYTQATGVNRAIWVMGLRNPFTFALKPGTSTMFINDVGQNAWEEINEGVAGANYGWNTCEGFCNPPNPNFRDPLFTYNHTATEPIFGCAIVGGAFYNPTTQMFPSDYVGDYFFADLCQGWIRRYDPSANTVHDFATGLTTPIDLAVTNDGALYYLARGGTGQVRRVVYNPNAPTFTPTRTRTNTAAANSPTPTRTRTNTPVVNSPTSTRTKTRVPNSPTATATRINTRRPTNTRTPTNTRRPTKAPTATFTPDGPWNFCSKQHKLCTFPGTRQVRYGAAGKYVIKTFTNSVQCSDAVFGDPAVGKPKVCHWK